MNPQERIEIGRALNTWRESVLNSLQREMEEASAAMRAAEDGLAIAFWNPGQVDDDIVAELWNRLETNSTLLWDLARKSDRIQGMNKVWLLTLFQRSEKLKTWPWEFERWNLPCEIS